MFGDDQGSTRDGKPIYRVFFFIRNVSCGDHVKIDKWFKDENKLLN